MYKMTVAKHKIQISVPEPLLNQIESLGAERGLNKSAMFCMGAKDLIERLLSDERLLSEKKINVETLPFTHSEKLR